MKQTVLLWTLILAAGCSAGRPAVEPDLLTEVQNVYDEIGRAVEQLDVAGVSRFSLPDASVRYADGTELTLPQWQERARKGWANVKAVKSRIVVRDVNADGDSAEVNYAERHEMTVPGTDGAADQAILYESEWRSTLERTKSGWRIKRSVELKRRVSRDGALIDQQPKPKS
jgi:hypothetical protein